MCKDIFMYEGELFGYGVGIDAPREVASGTCARKFNPSGTMAMIKSKAKIFFIFVLLVDYQSLCKSTCYFIFRLFLDYKMLDIRNTPLRCHLFL